MSVACPLRSAIPDRAARENAVIDDVQRRVRPPKGRKAQVVFYLFPEPLRASSKTTMEQLAVQALNENEKVKVVVVFGRSTERWGEPYEAVVVVTRTDEN
jgi:hypothetical protein